MFLLSHQVIHRPPASKKAPTPKGERVLLPRLVADLLDPAQFP